MHTTKTTSELRQGDIVNCHGLRCLIDGEILISRGHPDSPGVGDGKTRYTKALVLNRDAVSTALVPFGFTADWDRYPTVDRSSPLPHHGEHRWTIQGNDLATWQVEPSDLRLKFVTHRPGIGSYIVTAEGVEILAGTRKECEVFIYEHERAARAA